ncbi:NAD(P)-binding protein [Peniophora sp. CONT]|nr:NAD(P)-binding protein [Peniophora sp. CONT]
MSARFILPARRVAIVTGAARGIGRSIALRLCRDGHDVAVADLRGSAVDEVAQEIETMGRRSLPLFTDVSKEEEVEKMVGVVAGSLGSVDIMIANAGIGTLNTVLDARLEDYQDVMAVNAQGVFLCYKHAALKMVEQGRGGRIIGASSIAGRTGGEANFAYCASKFAVRGMTQAAALELAKHDITVNAYAPGAVDTDMAFANKACWITYTLPARECFAKLDGFKARMLASTPVGRMGTPDEIASCVSWLTSEDAGFVTGQTIGVDGGMRFD